MATPLEFFFIVTIQYADRDGHDRLLTISGNQEFASGTTAKQAYQFLVEKAASTTPHGIGRGLAVTFYSLQPVVLSS